MEHILPHIYHICSISIFSHDLPIFMRILLDLSCLMLGIFLLHPRPLTSLYQRKAIFPGLRWGIARIYLIFQYAHLHTQFIYIYIFVCSYIISKNLTLYLYLYIISFSKFHRYERELYFGMCSLSLSTICLFNALRIVE